MITAIEIENFKGIGERQRIELKPITLLFGPNSGGKSTVLHALLYAQEIFSRRNYDAGRTILGGDFVDLGGFLNFVHDHDPTKAITLRFDLDMRGVRWPDLQDRVEPEPYRADGRLRQLVKHAYVELAIRWNEPNRRAYCSRYEVGINGTRLGTIQYEPGQSGGKRDINSDHPIWASLKFYKMEQVDEKTRRSSEERVDAKEILRKIGPSIQLLDDALPAWGFTLDWGEWPRDDLAIDINVFLHIEQLLVQPGGIARDALFSLRYLGPLREKPARNYEPPRYPDPARWSSGLGQWDALQLGEADLVQEVSEWLARPDRLGTGYSLQRFEYRELDVDEPSFAALASGRGFDEADLDEIKKVIGQLPIRRRLVLKGPGTSSLLLPHDVGEGISQILPVVVSILQDPTKAVLIEQPELHVHPAVQVGLGDLLIAGLHDRTSPMLIETHSEHLLLRLLRRIRENKEGELPEGHPGLDPSQLSVVFMERGDGGIVATPLRIDETGEFIDHWPKGFFEERAKELF